MERKIEESYVSFDIARMLKDAGFDVPCQSFYRLSEKGSVTVWKDQEPHNQNECKHYYSRPTQTLAARWLREVYHIHIMITPMIDGWMIELFDLKRYQYILTNKDANTDSYEQAFELGLQEAIKLIKK